MLYALIGPALVAKGANTSVDLHSARAWGRSGAL